MNNTLLNITSTNDYIPFEKHYIIYKILNYGLPYKNYTTFTPIENCDNVETIYVDNQTCVNDINLEIVKENLPYYIEIHYTKESCKKKVETILKYHEIDNLISKYGTKL
jgi:hypothetical protein